MIFSPTGKAAITYRVVGTVSLAAGDPLGDPEAWPGAIAAWLDEARSFGWVPAVLGRQRARRRGVPPGRAWTPSSSATRRSCTSREFSLEGRSMRGVRQAVSRCERAGLTRDLPPGRRPRRRDAGDCSGPAPTQWRDGEVERGFSMALGRFGERADDRSVVVLCRDADGELRGLLHFVPWGADGLSLDLMRRDRDAENGIVEQMVAALMAEAPGARRHAGCR